MSPTLQEIQAVQGTRLSPENPWDSYDKEMGVNMTPELAQAVEEYSQRHYKKPSSETQETLAEQKEINNDLAQQYQWIKPEEYADYEARIGHVIDHRELITRLRKIGLNCFYRQHVHIDKAVLWIAKYPWSDELVKGPWVQVGQMPELSMMNFDERGIPLAERRRGWRTCLLQLILGGFITEEKVNKEFGEPRQDAAFDKYNNLVRANRNVGMGLE